MSIAGPTPEPPRRPGRGSLPILLLALLLLPACGRGETSGAAVDAGAGRPAASSPAPGSAADDAALARAALGEGFAAWESRRSGAWRIWAVDLAGGAPRQISPDEPGRNHCCAHASPDGSNTTSLRPTVV